MATFRVCCPLKEKKHADVSPSVGHHHQGDKPKVGKHESPKHEHDKRACHHNYDDDVARLRSKRKLRVSTQGP